MREATIKKKFRNDQRNVTEEECYFTKQQTEDNSKNGAGIGYYT